MSTFTLDTNLAANRLIEAGFEKKQADEIVDLLIKSQDGIVTKEYFKDYLDYKLEKDLNPIRLDLMAIKTTLAILVGGMISLIVKAYG